MELAKYIKESNSFIFVNEDYRNEKDNEVRKEKLEELHIEFPYEVVRTEPPTLADGEDVEEYFELEDDKVVQHYKIVRDTTFYQRKIDDLKLKLASTDYKITKCYEYSLVGKELPYDIVSLHEEKQSYRDEINSLEEEMKDESSTEQVD